MSIGGYPSFEILKYLTVETKIVTSANEFLNVFIEKMFKTNIKGEYIGTQIIVKFLHSTSSGKMLMPVDYNKLCKYLEQTLKNLFREICYKIL